MIFFHILFCCFADENILVEISVWERGDVCINDLEKKLTKSIRHALCDVIIEYYLLSASLSYIPHQSLNLSTNNSSSFDTSYRRTLDCGHGYSSKPDDIQSRSFAPVPFAPSPSTVLEVSTHENVILDSTSAVKPQDDDFVNGQHPKFSETSSLNTPDNEWKHRCYSEGNDRGVRRSGTKHLQTLFRSFSTSSSSKLEPQDFEENLKHGRFSPYEIFTDNELTESKQLSEQAVLANTQYLSDKTRKKSADVARDRNVREEEIQKMKVKRQKYENGETGYLHPR